MNAILLAVAILAVSPDQDQRSNPLPVHEGRIIDRFRVKHPLPLDVDGNPEGRVQHIGTAIGGALHHVGESFFKGFLGMVELPFTMAQAVSVGYIVAICAGLSCLAFFVLGGLIVIFFTIRLLRS